MAGERAALLDKDGLVLHRQADDATPLRPTTVRYGASLGFGICSCIQVMAAAGGIGGAMK